ncbi:DUF4232 domain-containing protein [Streptomyces sp. NPDC052114]|uniref:DUF4232 domain-containing protein n=1 Tax=unclassified Streptomyces TaxID=2593676 RepID=UPI003445FA1F
MRSAVRGIHRNSKAWKPYVLGAVAASALLAATACEPGGGDGSDDSKTSDRPSATASAKPGGTPDADGTPDAGGKKTVAACTEDVLSVSATKEPADSKDARHLLITVQNAGDEKCDLYHYPYVQLGADAQSTVPVIKDSEPDPGKPVTIAPGGEAHAALLVAGGGRDEYEVNSIALGLQGSKPGTDASEPIDVPMPVDTLYADDGQLVTYWTTASGMALDFIMSK